MNNKSEITFSSDKKVLGGTYNGTDTMLDAYGKCSNLYCHSNVQTSPPGGVLTYRNPGWSDQPFEVCNGCHEGPSDHFSMPVSGNTTRSHSKHASYGSFPCYACHANDPAMDGCQSCHTTDGSGPYDNHANYAIEVAFINKYGGTYSGTTTPGDAYGQCSNTYCHSSGKGTYTNPVWGGSALGCNSCHGTGNALGRPDYANAGAGQPNANSHAKHALASSDCKSCHKDTTLTGTTINSTTLHVNKSLDVTFDATVAGSGATWTAATKTCSSVLCHGSGTPQWGATGLACQSCHLGTDDVDNFTGTLWDNGTAGVIKNTGEWDTTGHGKASGTYASGNSAAGFASANACLYCHDDTITHKVSTNPFRLKNITNATWGKNGNCQSCHATGSAGVTVDSVLKNGVRKVDSTHYGAKHASANSGGQFCWDCHDPHGDSNIFMVHASVAKTSDITNGAPVTPVATVFTASATGTDYAKSTSPFNGICNVCHAATMHYTSAGGDNHMSTTRCTQCHKHTGKAMTDAFGVDCLGCHSTQQGSRAPVVGQFSGNSHHIQGVTLTIQHCYQCHWEADSNGSVTSYHGGTSTSAVNLVIYGSGTRPATYAAGTTSVEYTANGSRTELQKINQHCLGCHSAKNDATQPFGDGKTPKQYAWDNTSIDARYSQTGTTAWGKYSGANVTPKNTQTKAYSAHGNASSNQRGWNTSETWPNTSGTANVLCYDCHNSHSSAVTGTTTSYTSATTNGAILKDTTANQGGYTMTYKPVAGGSTTTKNIYNAGAAICFDCHMTATGGTKPWGYQETFGASQVIMGYFDTQYFGTGATGPQQRYIYKASAGQIKGGHFGASSSMATPVNGTIGGLCTPCHDPHGVSTTLGTNQQYGVPLLKGTWMTSPYKEDAAPQSKTEPRGGGDSRSRLNVGSTPGYHIDQNTFETLPTTVSYTWNFNSTKRVTQTVEQFAGLCLKCHPKTSIAPGTNNTWKSVDRIHNSVQGWGTFSGNNNNAVHSYTCSKCHAPHNSNLNRLMVTNCLDFSHRGRVASGGTVSLNQQTDSDNEGRGNGRFPGGGGGYGREKTVWGNRIGGAYFYGIAGTSGSVYPNLRQCHDTANTAETWPNGERWNIKTPW